MNTLVVLRTSSVDFLSSESDIKGVGWITSTGQSDTELTRWNGQQLSVGLT